MSKSEPVYVSYKWLSNGDVVVEAATSGGRHKAVIKCSPLRTLDETIQAAIDRCKILVEAANAKK